MALSRHHGDISKPLSIQEIVDIAHQFEFGTNRPLKGWLRAAQMLLTEAAICEQDGNLQMAYLYLYRHAELVLGKFPRHPEFNSPQLKADITQAQRAVQTSLAKLEQWKPRIKNDHQRYVKAMERRNAEIQRIQNERLNDERSRRSNDWMYRDSLGSEDETFSEHAQALNANEHKQLAVDLAHQELRRRDATRQSTRQAGISAATVASRRRGIVVDADEVPDPSLHDIDGVSEGVKEAGQYLRSHSQQRPSEARPEHRKPSSTSFTYPSVPAKEDTINWKMSSMQPDRKPGYPTPVPSLPPKEIPEDRFARLDLNAPPIASKPRDSTISTPSTATPSPPPITQAPPSKYTFKPTTTTEAGAPLRTVLLPPELRSSFLNLAHPNTLRNLETCGILCATLVSNALFINHLVIPDQKSTSDTCDTTEEGDNELFDFCDSHDLLVCGWIHTHPSQSCFLSSPDLHTSSGYQVMMPEAIAIVCAPRHNPDWGVFRLTDPPGLKHILNCDQKSIFHPHSETNLYTDAISPGHVVEGPGLKFQVVDLRKS